LALADIVLGTPAAAAADSGPTSSNPAAQAILASPPAAVELTFPAAPDPDFSHVSVLTADGTRTNSGALTRSADRTLRQPVSIGSSGDVTI
ncbi:copper resistance CopC family protein, partial [Klebsiella pneumoniae]|uniref:copper resistance CopC family protein n=1 Tax=Klebsiella pneumoniae TaxID=573 RepID=UPI0030141A50